MLYGISQESGEIDSPGQGYDGRTPSSLSKIDEDESWNTALLFVKHAHDHQHERDVDHDGAESAIRTLPSY